MKGYAQDEINLIDYLIVLLRHKKLIVAITLSVSVITAIISLGIPSVYMAETKVLPPQLGGSTLDAQFLSRVGGGSLAGGLLGGKSLNFLYTEFFKARPVLDRIIDRFKLMEVYKSEDREEARATLARALATKGDVKSGILSIAVEDEDPVRAADMANAFVEEVRDTTRNLAVTEASRRRLFFEKRLVGAKDNLIRAEEDLRKFQEKTGAIEIKKQANAVLGELAKLRAQIAEREVQLRVMKTYATSQNPDIQKLEEGIKGVREQLEKLEGGTGNNPDPLLSTAKIPGFTTEYIRKMRDFKFYESVYESLLKQYEASRLAEARESVIMQVIEKAIPPKRKIKPRRKRMVMVAALAGLMLSVFTAFLLEYIKASSEDPERRESFQTLMQHLGFRNRGGRKN